MGKNAELLKAIEEVTEKILKGNDTPWVIFPSITLTYEDFMKYRKIKEK